MNDADPNSQITDGLTRALAEPGEMLTKYVAVAEVMNADGRFRLVYSTDGVTPWDCVGMMRWAADHMYDTEDDDQ